MHAPLAVGDHRVDAKAVGVRKTHDRSYRRRFVPLGGLRFACDYGVVEFLEDSEGEISRMQVWDEFPLFRGQALTDSN